MKTTNSSQPASLSGDSLKNLSLLWQTQPFVPDTNLIDFSNLAGNNPAVGMLFNCNPCLTWVLDIRTEQFVFMSENSRQFIGYESNLFIRDGYKVVSKLLHLEDKKTIGELTFRLWKKILGLPADKRKGYRFSRKYRVRKPDGTYICLLEQNTVIQTDSQGNITHVLTNCTDITEVVKLNNFVPTVQVAAGQAAPGGSPEEGRSGFQTKLSKREKEIVRLVAEGYSSKLIADQLFISFHTVNTHRKNIIGKTHSKNTSDLVQYAISNRII